MLYPVMLFRAFGIIPMIHGSYQIAGDTADALKRFVSVIFHAAHSRDTHYQ